MNELKTLRNMSFWGLIPYLGNGSFLGGVTGALDSKEEKTYCESTLKREAIKWIKHIQSSNKIVFNCGCEMFFETPLINTAEGFFLTKWIKHFFALTEEEMSDLKTFDEKIKDKTIEPILFFESFFGYRMEEIATLLRLVNERHPEYFEEIKKKGRRRCLK